MSSAKCPATHRRVCFVCLKNDDVVNGANVNNPAYQARILNPSCWPEERTADNAGYLQYDLYTRFLHFTSRHLKLNCTTERFLIGVRDWKKERNEPILAFCENCECLISHICDLYAELNIVKLHLLLKLHNLGKRVEDTDKSVSRKLVHGLMRSLVKQLNVQSPMQVDSLRKIIAAKCKYRNQESSPKVLVLRGLFPDEWKYTYAATKKSLMVLIVIFAFLSPIVQPNGDTRNQIVVKSQTARKHRRHKKVDNSIVSSPELKIKQEITSDNEMALETNNHKTSEGDDDGPLGKFGDESDSDWSQGAASPIYDGSAGSGSEMKNDDEAMLPKKRWNFRGRKSVRTEARDSDSDSEKGEDSDSDKDEFIPKINKKKKANSQTRDELVPNCIPCKHCDSVFVDKKGLRKHVLNVHGTRIPYTCRECGIEFIKNSERAEHRRIAHPAKQKSPQTKQKNKPGKSRDRFPCSKCSSTYSRQGVLNKHMQVFHGTFLEFPCPHCGLKFKVYKELVRHKKTMHRTRVNIKRRHQVESKCAECNQTFPNQTAMFLHKKQNHKIRATKHECPICFRTVISKQRLQRHIEAHASNTLRNVKVFYCEVCGKHFYKENSLSEHMVKVHDGSFCCFQCGVKYPYANFLRKHLETHETEEKSFFCDYCFRGFTTQQYSDIHRKIAHLGKRKFFCDYDQCFEDYSSIESLNEHLKSHITLNSSEGMGEEEGSAIFTCSTCGWGFVKPFNLKLHELLHVNRSKSKSGTGYDCPECGKNVRYKETLLAHYNRAHGVNVPPMKCDQCYKSFTCHAYLKQHIRHHYKTNAVDLPYKCDICSLDWKDMRSLIAHKRIHKDDIAMTGTSTKGSEGKSESEDLSWMDPASPPPLQKIKVKRRVGRPRKNPIELDVKEEEAEKKTHTKEETPSVPCEICENSYESAYLLRKHMEADHETEKQSFQCFFCYKKFTHLQTQALHVKAMHKEKRFECDDEKCDEVFDNCDKLKEHLMTHLAPLGKQEDHIDIQTEGHTDKDSAIGTLCDSSTNIKFLKHCKICNWGFLDDRARELHELCHISKTDKGFKCPQCPDSFVTTPWLTQHYNRLHGINLKPYKCLECDNTFFSRSSLQSHIYRHDMRRKIDESFVCVDCGNQYKDARCLKVHRRRHNPDFHAQCADCGEKFVSAKLLTIHTRRVHNKGDRYPCHICGMTFIFHSYVNKHIKEVHCEGKYECEICHKKFKRTQNLNHHLKTHDPNRKPDYVCADCGRGFNCEEGLRYHVRSKHTPRTEWKYVCPHCSRRFTRGMLLKAHLKSCARKHETSSNEANATSLPNVRSTRKPRNLKRNEDEDTTNTSSEDDIASESNPNSYPSKTTEQSETRNQASSSNRSVISAIGVPAATDSNSNQDNYTRDMPQYTATQPSASTTSTGGALHSNMNPTLLQTMAQNTSEIQSQRNYIHWLQASAAAAQEFSSGDQFRHNN